MMRIAQLENRFAGKKLMMSSVTENAIPDSQRLVKLVKKILSTVDKSSRKWSVSTGYSDNPLQTIILCSHNDQANTRYEQEVLVVHHQGTANGSKSFKTEITTGSQSYMQANLATALSFLVKVADAERQEIMLARQSGDDFSMVRPVYDFSGRSSLKLQVPVALVVPDANRLAKAVLDLLKEKTKNRRLRWKFVNSNTDFSNKLVSLTFTSSAGVSKELFVAFAGTQGSGAKFDFTSEGKTSKSLNVITTHMLADKPMV